MFEFTQETKWGTMGQIGLQPTVHHSERHKEIWTRSRDCNREQKETKPAVL